MAGLLAYDHRTGRSLFCSPRAWEKTTRKPFYPFRSERAKVEYEAFRLKRAEGWPLFSETQTLDTASGRTFVRACGRITDPSLVLLLGVRSASLTWTHHAAALSDEHRIYALDVIGNAGLSVNRRDIPQREELERLENEL